MLMTPVVRDVVLLGLIWLVYFIIHSLLASLTVKTWVSRRMPDLMPAYRLTFNSLAMLLLLPPLWLMYTGEKAIIWELNGATLWATQALAVSAVIGFLISTRYYDGLEFLGLRQLREHETRVEDQENLHLSPFHRFVRHPWYFFGLVLIWTRPMDSLMLLSAIVLTLYFYIGSRLEERKLIHYYGDVYLKYRERVPGLIPLPWKYLKTTEVNALIDDYRSTHSG